MMGYIEPVAHEAGHNTTAFAGTEAELLVPAAATGDAFALLRFGTPAGNWTPPHRHRVDDETIYVLCGAVRAETPDAPCPDRRRRPEREVALRA